MYPMIHPMVLCITSSTSENPRPKKYCIVFIDTDIHIPTVNVINHEPLTLNNEPSIIPTGMNTIMFITFSVIKSVFPFLIAS